jgi:hypothetical protein
MEELEDEEWPRNDAPSNPTPQALEFYGGDYNGQRDTPQSRSNTPPLMVYSPPPPPPPPISITEMNVPPPPPIRLPNGGYSSLIPTTTRSASLSNLDHEQESLRDLRDKLVGVRFSTAAKRSELRDLHMETSAKAGHVFNLLRQYLNEKHIDLPRNIEESISDASSLRDQLGLLEVEYEEAEVNYNALEWRYSRRETRFVEGLLNSKLVPSDAIDRSRSADSLEIAHLTKSMTRSFEDEPMAWNHTLFIDEPDPRYNVDIPTDLEKAGVVSKDTAIMRHQQTGFSRRESRRLAPMRSGHEAQIHSIHSQLDWLERARRIDAWLLEMVNNSSVYQESLRTIDDFGFSDKRTWWNQTKWLLIQDYEPHFRTGDSTASEHATGRATCIFDITNSNLNTTPVKHRSADTVEIGFHPSDVPDPPTTPIVIRPEDPHDAIDEAKAPKESPNTSYLEATNSRSISLASTHSVPRCVAVAGSEAFPDDDLIDDVYTRSPPMIGGSSSADRVAFGHPTEATSSFPAPVFSYQSVPGNIRPNLNHIQQAYSSLENRKSEAKGAIAPPRRSYSTSSLLPHSSLPAVTSISDPMQFRRRVSEIASSPLRRRLVVKRSSSAATSKQMSSPKRDNTSPARNFNQYCLVM